MSFISLAFFFCYLPSKTNQIQWLYKKLEQQIRRRIFQHKFVHFSSFFYFMTGGEPLIGSSINYLFYLSQTQDSLRQLKKNSSELINLFSVLSRRLDLRYEDLGKTKAGFKSDCDRYSRVYESCFNSPQLCIKLTPRFPSQQSLRFCNFKPRLTEFHF